MTLHPDRRVLLQGAVNCRDLGGYLSADGRRVRWGQLYRSDSLAELTDADLDALQARGLRHVCDLRHESEQRAKPSRALGHEQVQVHSIGFFPHGAQELIRRVRSGTVSPAQAHADFVEMYRRLPLEEGATYARVLDLLVDERALPLLVHCTSGKDRTGFAAAVILMALDIPRDTISADYLLTNQFRRDLSFVLGANIDPELMSTVTQAHPDYLGAAFASIDAHWGSPARFLEQALGLTPPRRQALQALLLEAVA